MQLTSAGSHSPRSMPRHSRVAPVPASARESASAKVPEPVSVLAQVRELASMAAREPVPARAAEPPLVGSMASLALTSRRRRTLPRAARTPQAEELT
jgi:hypothetical protein